MRKSTTPIQPVVKTRELALRSGEAFELFTAHIGRWWPLESHSITEADATGVRFEGRVGGRVVEIAADGTEHPWADVIAWDPPHRLAMAWHPTTDPIAASIVEVVFEETPSGCLVRLEHRGWEEFGAEVGTAARDRYDPGWDGVLARYLQSAESAERPSTAQPASGSATQAS